MPRHIQLNFWKRKRKEKNNFPLKKTLVPKVFYWHILLNVYRANNINSTATFPENKRGGNTFQLIRSALPWKQNHKDITRKLQTNISHEHEHKNSTFKNQWMEFTISKPHDHLNRCGKVCDKNKLHSWKTLSANWEQKPGKDIHRKPTDSMRLIIRSDRRLNASLLKRGWRTSTLAHFHTLLRSQPVQWSMKNQYKAYICIDWKRRKTVSNCNHTIVYIENSKEPTKNY